LIWQTLGADLDHLGRARRRVGPARDVVAPTLAQMSVQRCVEK
jgi:hypothetical protein